MTELKAADSVEALLADMKGTGRRFVRTGAIVRVSALGADGTLYLSNNGVGMQVQIEGDRADVVPLLGKNVRLFLGVVEDVETPGGGT